MPTTEEYALLAQESATNAAVSADNAEASAASVSGLEVIVGASEANTIAKASEANVHAEDAAISAGIATGVTTNVSNAVTAAQLAETNAYNASIDALDALNSISSIYLGGYSVDPTTSIEGATYWNTVSKEFKVWNGTSWQATVVTAFNGIVDGGTSDIPNDSIILRKDTSVNWGIHNPILGNGEVGLETDSLLLKFGDGISTWNVLEYPTIDRTNVIGIDKIDNTSDLDKPVSTLQEEANTLILTTANEYTDTSILGLLSDQGSYSPDITNEFPIGTILKGYTWNIISTGTLGSKTVKYGDSIRALIDNPGQTESNWLLIPGLENISNPISIGTYVMGRPLPEQLVFYYGCNFNITLPMDLVNSIAISKVAPISPITFSIRKNGLELGTINFTTVTGTFTFINTVTFVQGDILEIYAPITQDAIFSDITISLYGIR